jgi:hypothetical protein
LNCGPATGGLPTSAESAAGTGAGVPAGAALETAVGDPLTTACAAHSAETAITTSSIRIAPLNHFVFVIAIFVIALPSPL